MAFSTLTQSIPAGSASAAAILRSLKTAWSSVSGGMTGPSQSTSPARLASSAGDRSANRGPGPKRASGSAASSALGSRQRNGGQRGLAGIRLSPVRSPRGFEPSLCLYIALAMTTHVAFPQREPTTFQHNMGNPFFGEAGTVGWRELGRGAGRMRSRSAGVVVRGEAGVPRPC